MTPSTQSQSSFFWAGGQPSFSSEKELLAYRLSRVAENVISGKFSFMRFSSQLLRTR